MFPRIRIAEFLKIRIFFSISLSMPMWQSDYLAVSMETLTTLHPGLHFG